MPCDTSEPHASAGAVGWASDRRLETGEPSGGLARAPAPKWLGPRGPPEPLALLTVPWASSCSGQPSCRVSWLRHSGPCGRLRSSPSQPAAPRKQECPTLYRTSLFLAKRATLHSRVKVSGQSFGQVPAAWVSPQPPGSWARACGPHDGSGEEESMDRKCSDVSSGSGGMALSTLPSATVPDAGLLGRLAGCVPMATVAPRAPSPG